MWEKYPQLRSSVSFEDVWVKFLSDSVNETPYPIFYQFVIDKNMDNRINQHFAVQSENAAN
jgi:hypothetical protein